MLIKAAINGTRTRAEHPAIPVTPEQQAQQAKAAVAVGAGAIHVHVRQANEYETLAPDDVARTLECIRYACPGIPVGISTGAWIVPDVEQRLSLIQAWDVLPDFVSVNIHEKATLRIIRLLIEKGVGVEAGVWNSRAAERWVNSGLADECLRVLIEPAEEQRDAIANLEEIETVLAGNSRPRLLHGLDGSAWDMVVLAAQKGYDTRIGFEDTLRLRDGSYAENNAALVKEARSIVERVRKD